MQCAADADRETARGTKGNLKVTLRPACSLPSASAAYCIHKHYVPTSPSVTMDNPDKLL